ncbi:hypothetical protein GCM10010231_38670 [Streptomyces sindenensis]|nr:hypothetical protein GCM10010231_38670 [Streptomyces sindenensis]
MRLTGVRQAPPLRGLPPTACSDTHKAEFVVESARGGVARPDQIPLDPAVLQSPSIQPAVLRVSDLAQRNTCHKPRPHHAHNGIGLGRIPSRPPRTRTTPVRGETLEPHTAIWSQPGPRPPCLRANGGSGAQLWPGAGEAASEFRRATRAP